MVKVVAYGIGALAASLLLCVDVYAQRQLSKAATSGRATSLEGYAYADNNCQVVDPPPETIIEQAPVHGIVCLRRGDILFNLPLEGNLSHCAGKKASGGFHVI